MDNIEMNLNEQDALKSAPNSEIMSNIPMKDGMSGLQVEKIPISTRVQGEDEQFLKKKRESGMNLEKNQNEFKEIRSSITEGNS